MAQFFLHFPKHETRCTRFVFHECGCEHGESSPKNNYDFEIMKTENDISELENVVNTQALSTKIRKLEKKEISQKTLSDKQNKLLEDMKQDPSLILKLREDIGDINKYKKSERDRVKAAIKALPPESLKELFVSQKGDQCTLQDLGGYGDITFYYISAENLFDDPYLKKDSISYARKEGGYFYGENKLSIKDGDRITILNQETGEKEQEILEKGIEKARKAFKFKKQGKNEVAVYDGNLKDIPVKEATKYIELAYGNETCTCCIDGCKPKPVSKAKMALAAYLKTQDRNDIHTQVLKPSTNPEYEFEVDTSAKMASIIRLGTLLPSGEKHSYIKFHQPKSGQNSKEINGVAIRMNLDGIPGYYYWNKEKGTHEKINALNGFQFKTLDPNGSEAQGELAKFHNGKTPEEIQESKYQPLHKTTQKDFEKSMDQNANALGAQKTRRDAMTQSQKDSLAPEDRAFYENITEEYQTWRVHQGLDVNLPEQKNVVSNNKDNRTTLESYFPHGNISPTPDENGYYHVDVFGSNDGIGTICYDPKTNEAIFTAPDAVDPTALRLPINGQTLPSITFLAVANSSVGPNQFSDLFNVNKDAVATYDFTNNLPIIMQDLMGPYGADQFNPQVIQNFVRALFRGDGNGHTGISFPEFLARFKTSTGEQLVDNQMIIDGRISRYRLEILDAINNIGRGSASLGDYQLNTITQS